MMCGLDANWCVLSIDVVVSQWGWHMSWSCTLILDCHNTTYKVKRRNNNYARYYCQNTQITSWGSARPDIKFWVYMLDKYIFVDFYSIHLIQALIRQGSWSSVGVLVNFSLSWVGIHPRCIHDPTWDLTLTHLIQGGGVLMVTLRALHGQDFTTQYSAATLLHANKPNHTWVIIVDPTWSIGRVLCT